LFILCDVLATLLLAAYQRKIRQFFFRCCTTLLGTRLYSEFTLVELSR